MKNVSNEELLKISNFNASVEDLIHGKFILADTKISKLLETINNSKDMFRFVSECLINFDYSKELGRAEMKNSLNKGAFNCPKEDEKIVALVFCLLNDFAIKKLDYYTFIKSNFGINGENEQYKLFAKTLLIPFKEIISNNFCLEKEESEQKENVQENEFSQLKVVLQQIKNIIENDKKINNNLKEDIIYILDSTIYATKYNDIKLVGALLTSFEILTKKINSIKFQKQELHNLLLKFY